MVPQVNELSWLGLSIKFLTIYLMVTLIMFFKAHSAIKHFNSVNYFGFSLFMV